MHRILSVSYGRGETQEGLLALLDRIFQAESMVKVHEEIKHCQVLTIEQLLDAPNAIEIGDHQCLGDLEIGQLSQNKLDFLTRSLELIEVKYANSCGTLTSSCELSQENDFPALGSSLWLESTLILPAGFVEVSAINGDVEEGLQRIVRQLTDRSN